MGRHLNKKDYRLRAIRIVELRDKEGLEFADIARRLSIDPSVVGRSYHQLKEKA